MTARVVDIDTAAAGLTGPVAAVGTGRPLLRRRWRLALTAAVLIASATIATLVWPHADPGRSARMPDRAILTYVDPNQHFRIDYPRGWQVHADGSGGTIFDREGAAVSVKEFTLGSRIGPDNLQNMRAVTDAILTSPKVHLTILATQVVHVGELTGLYYLYTFPSGSQVGAHAHYFLFSGNRMFTIVCQTVPATGFQELANTFDAMTQSFVVTG